MYSKFTTQSLLLVNSVDGYREVTKLIDRQFGF